VHSLTHAPQQFSIPLVANEILPKGSATPQNGFTVIQNQQAAVLLQVVEQARNAGSGGLGRNLLTLRQNGDQVDEEIVEGRGISERSPDDMGEGVDGWMGGWVDG
jgi:hypothetical protein